MYGLDNNLGSANNVIRTLNSAKFKNFMKKTGKYGTDVLNIMSGIEGMKNGKTGWERIQSATDIAKNIMAMAK